MKNNMIDKFNIGPTDFVFIDGKAMMVGKNHRPLTIDINYKNPKFAWDEFAHYHPPKRLESITFTVDVAILTQHPNTDEIIKTVQKLKELLKVE